MQSFNCAGALLLWRTFTLGCLGDGRRTKESSDQYSWLISVFLFARDVSREAFATN